MDILRRLFGLSSRPKKDGPKAKPVATSVPKSSVKPVPLVRRQRTEPGEIVNANYYQTMGALQGAISKQDYTAAANLVRANLKLIPAWAKAQIAEYGRFDISSIPAIDRGRTILAIAGDGAALTEMADIIAKLPALAPWAEGVRQSLLDVQTVKEILAAVQASPGLLQSDLVALIKEQDVLAYLS
jgi:hypothetical protein